MDYALHRARALANRASEWDLPKIAKVASRGGETVPPHTASRIGCASLPSDTPASASDVLMTSISNPNTSGGHMLAHGLVVIGRRRPEEEQAIRRHLLHRLRPLALRQH